ncbi:unnamed protein product [Pocillopora meandrina]|uniref:Uncharacterized protein n=1 Tax=Pocillopora meandrina TaxID=46732 RepID=A0AAU9VN61_9CNID|nr:unnamed protein product [Pocillopora meandrina]
MFPQGKYAKTISRNAQYIIAFKNPRDKVALRTLLLQIYPTKWLPVMDIYNACTDRPYGYLLFDVHPASRDSTRLLSHLLRHEGCTFLMVKPDEFRALVDYYKGKITESTLLDKAARVAAEAKLLLEDTSTPAALKEPVVKELLMQECKLTDKLRQIPIAGGVEPPPRDDDGNLMEGLQEGLLKELIKSINMRGQAAVPQMTLKREPVTPVGIKNEPVTPAKPGTSKIPFLTAPSQKIQKTKRKLPVPTPQKHRTELERLKEFGNWEPWEKRGYDPYQVFEDDETPKSKKGKGRGKNRPS